MHAQFECASVEVASLALQGEQCPVTLAYISIWQTKELLRPSPGKYPW